MVPDIFGIVVDNFPKAPDFKVTFIGIDDDIEVIIGFLSFTDHGSEHILQNTDHRRTIYVFPFRKLCKGFD